MGLTHPNFVLKIFKHSGMFGITKCASQKRHVEREAKVTAGKKRKWIMKSARIRVTVLTSTADMAAPANVNINRQQEQLVFNN